MNYDTLDFLIPPVRKRYENDEFTKEYSDIRGSVRRPKQFSTKLPNHITKFSRNQKADVGTSSSLELKKITNKLLREHFSVSNFLKKKAKTQKIPISNTNVIKITVVPITTETQTPKIILKRNQIVKKIHKTVSNTNNSIKNNILRLPRRRRENHDIRETSSADLFKPTWKKNTKHDELSLNRMTYTKTIINSLNMNHKIRQERVSQQSHEAQISPRNTIKSYKVMKEGCVCNSTKINDVLDDMNARKNRVTIIGRLGINENDQYILNCAATVNNEPIKTYTAQQKFDSASIDQLESCGGINKITKATQADLNIGLTYNKSKNTTVNNKNVQCHCKNAKDVATTISECKFTASIERKSPLIVISVYPTKDTVDNIKDLGDLIQINQLQKSQDNDKNPFTNFSTLEHKMGSKVGQNNLTPEKTPLSSPLTAVGKRKLENRSFRNRSPSTPLKSFSNNKVENRSLRSRSRSPSVKNTVNENSKNKLIRQTSQKSFRSPDRQNRQPKINKVLPQKDKTNRMPNIVNAAQTSKMQNQLKNAHGPPSSVKETNSKKNKIKKAIVDSYTQRILMPIKGKDTIKKDEAKPRSNASSVAINIDGDNERYRVLFLQDKLSTDLSIRKTLKSNKQKPLNESKNKEKGYSNEDSMKNCHIAKETVLSKNLGTLSNQLNNSQAQKGTSGLKTRDSLEMRHWHEDYNDQYKKNTNIDYEPRINIMHKSMKQYVDDEDFSAPVKHYRGDQCCIPNPTLRDQEIRQLLGIKKPRSGKSECVQEVLPELIGEKLHNNLHPKKCVKSRSSISHQSYSSFKETQNKININDQPKLVSAWTQCEYKESNINSCNQMVLTRNVQVFLQVEQFTKQKPIMLSQKQYEKVKKTIQTKASHKIIPEWRRLNNSRKCSVVSIGEIHKIRKKQKSNMKISRTVQAERNSIHKQIYEDKWKIDHEVNKPSLTQKTTIDDINLIASSRQLGPSMEIHYASLTHLRNVTFSSNNIKNKHGSLLCLREKYCSSVQTIFKGHKKCVTPNLGTSAYSVYTDEEINNSDNKYNFHPHDEKPKVPFLRRLMSCLVMRSNRTSEAILPRQYEQPSLMNSFDSYHINTSLGAIELTSSLYDTSASFYSKHTILPIGRMKRGFLSSVRGFLTNLKSR